MVSQISTIKRLKRAGPVRGDVLGVGLPTAAQIQEGWGAADGVMQKGSGPVDDV